MEGGSLYAKALVDSFTIGVKYYCLKVFECNPDTFRTRLNDDVFATKVSQKISSTYAIICGGAAPMGTMVERPQENHNNFIVDDMTKIEETEHDIYQQLIDDHEGSILIYHPKHLLECFLKNFPSDHAQQITNAFLLCMLLEENDYEGKDFNELRITLHNLWRAYSKRFSRI